jgi:two-component system, NtrC family, response regulator GlrR
LSSGDQQPEDETRGLDPANRIKVMAICLAGAKELGASLETVLKPAQNVELLRKDLSEEGLGRQLSTSGDSWASFQPHLFLLCLPPRSAQESRNILQALRQSSPELSILVILETAAPQELNQFIDMGVADFCLAPLRLDELLPRMMRWSLVGLETKKLTRQLHEFLGLHQMVGHAAAFVEAVNTIPKLARSEANVLITGETGTGKEMCARAIHQIGPRADHPFIPLNCGAIPPELVENELFGHDAGAFTSAAAATRGLVHDAEGGTLFLDEVDSLSLATQVKFLRFLQDQVYRPLGGRRTHQANVRIIAASNVDLEEAVRSGRFRADLFYRLNILPLKLPALRDRQEDIPVLARHFLAECARASSTPVKGLSQSALDKLLLYDWPGNIRELRNIVERALVLSERPMITSDDLWLPGLASPAADTSFKVLKAHAVAQFESAYVRRLLAANDGNISQAARVAKKNRRAFWQLMRKHEIAVAAKGTATMR